MSSLFPLNANADVRDATSSAQTLVSALIISSLIPSVKNSFSASALMFVNGRTAIDLRLLSAASAGIAAARTLANSETVGNRSAGSSDSARSTTSEAAAGTLALDDNGCGAALN